MEQSKTNPFEIAKQSVILKVKVIPVQAFIYRDINDLPNLIKFVGSRPVINPDMTFAFKKQVVKNNSVITRNQYGEVTRVMTFDEANGIYDIAAQSEWKDDQANTVQAKEVKERKPRTKK